MVNGSDTMDGTIEDPPEAEGLFDELNRLID